MITTSKTARIANGKSTKPNSSQTKNISKVLIIFVGIYQIYLSLVLTVFFFYPSKSDSLILLFHETKTQTTFDCLVFLSLYGLVCGFRTEGFGS